MINKWNRENPSLFPVKATVKPALETQETETPKTLI